MNQMNYDFSKPNKLSRKAFWLALVKAFWSNFKIFWGVFAIFLFKKGNNSDDKFQFFLIFSAIFLVISILIFIFQYIKYKYFSYQIIDNELIIREGWLSKSETVVKFDKIHEVHLNQKFIHKIVGLYKLDIDTAGSDKVEISINGIDYHKALVIKDILTEKQILSEIRKDRITDENLEANDNFTSLRISILTLFKIGITQNYLYTLSLMFAFSYQIIDFITDIFYEKRSDFVNQISEFSNTISTIFFWIFFLFILILFVIIFNLIRTLLTYYNYEIQIKNNRLLASYGLINSHIVAVPPKKVQMIHFQQNYFQKLMNLFEMRISQIDSSENKEKKTQGLLIPGINYLEMSKLFQFVYNKDFEELKEFHRPSFRKVVIRAMYLFFAFLMIIFTMYFIDILRFTWIPTLLFFVVLSLIYISYRNEKLFLKDDFIILKSGIWDLTTTYLQVNKIQEVKIKQSYFQKRRRLVSIRLSTASESLRLNFYDEKLLKNLVNESVYKIEFVI
ncbi:PH domain-containing protein [Capnocytophaga stomatis]|uniref:PH domain-containing protein n=1 Tax=Capnocytophaga stomatis TaxID=1848904 RepID=UPI00195012E4|nr:PH domain-containing protein [Capnocytophaga stomatis]